MPLIRIALFVAAAVATTAVAAAAPSCQATAAATVPTIVELYTSEGCSSCPPADQWLSKLKGRNDVLALAFHVNYWDQLGWTDRFATPESTARQTTLARAAGGSQVYTPQVLVNGRDWRSWPQLPKTAAASTVGLTLVRDGDQVTAQVAQVTTTVGPAKLAGYWAVLEDGYQSQVRAGENAGETLHHDHVVRLYRPVAAWTAADGLRTQLTVSKGVAEYPRRIVFVVTDLTTAKPLQAVALSCS
jgi:hypothetical protein